MALWKLLVPVAALGTLVIAWPGSAGAALTEKGRPLVYFRQVLCFVPAYNPTDMAAPKLGTTSCAPNTVLSPANLGITASSDSPDGFSEHMVPPDSDLAGTPSTAASSERASSVVLLPGLQNASVAPDGARYLLGPAQMTSASIQSAVAIHHYGQWLVDYSMTPSGKRMWDKTTHADFHRLLALDYDGQVISAPIIQPSLESFVSFEGRGEIGGLTKSEAKRFARALGRG
jgi:preprotein translocase subunit SecD